MADANIAVTEGSGKNVDTRTNAGGDHRQVIVLGDPSVTDNVAAVATQDLPGTDQTTPAIVVRTAGSMTIGQINKTVTVALDPGYTLGKIEGINTTVAVYFDRGDPGVKITSGTVTGITNSIAVHVLSTNGTMGVRFSDEPYVVAEGKYGATKAPLLVNTDGAIKVYDVVNGTISTVAAVTNITNSIAIYLGATAGTLHVRLADNSAGVITDDTAFTPATDVVVPVGGLYDDTATDSVDEGDAGIFRMTGNRIQMTHDDSTASIFTVSGSTSGVSVSGVQLVAPSANAAFKVFALALTTTAQVGITARFTNGAGTGPIEYWRYALQAPAQGIAGANLSVSPPAYLFATGTSTTLSLVLDSASLVHYSVSYRKEST